VVDVFLSYAREDRERAGMVASALETQGWSVWWDRKIVAGQSFDRTIEEQLKSARAVVVLWSIHSIDSEWVRNEAADASEREALVPALIDDVKQPLEFRRRHAANLTAWSGDPADPEFLVLHHGLKAKCGLPRAASDGAEGAAQAGLTAPGVAEVAASSPGRPSEAESDQRSGIAMTIAAWPRRYVIVAASIAVSVALVWMISRLGENTGGTADLQRVELRAVPPGEESTSPRSARPAGAPSPDLAADSRSLKAGSEIGRDADHPASIAFDTISRVRLLTNEAFYLRLPTPASDVDVVLDMRLVDDVVSNLQASLSVLDENGGVVRDSIIGFNEVDRMWRKTATYSASQPARHGFRMVNTAGAADFWLTVRRSGAPGLVPFFGETVPQTLEVGAEYRGRLATNDNAYYRASLPRGDYQAVLEFALQPAQQSNIGGSLSTLDASGGNATSVITLNEIDVSYRKSARFSVSRPEAVIFRVQNSHNVVGYLLRVEPAPAGTAH
jgi:TIR domain-containing protein